MSDFGYLSGYECGRRCEQSQDSRVTLHHIPPALTVTNTLGIFCGEIYERR